MKVVGRASFCSGVLACLVACGTLDETSPDASIVYGELTVGGGTAEPGFVDLENGQDLTLEPGSQGGFHIFFNVRVEAKSMTPNRELYIDRTARRTDTDQLVSKSRQLRTFEEIESGGYFDSTQSMLMFLCPAPIGIQVHDKTLRVRMRALVDHEDEQPVAEGTIEITPRCPTGQHEEFCRRICSGE